MAAVAPSPLSRDQASRFCAALIAVLIMMLGLARGMAAQGFGPAADSRRGFWVSAGVGQGYSQLRCAICDADKPTGGLAAHVRAGGTYSNRLLLGGDVTYWRRREGDILEQSTGVAGTGYWYPRPRHGYYLKFGLGVSWYRAADDGIALTAQLLTAVAGAGYEMRVNPRISMVPFLNLSMTAKGDLLREDTRNGGFTASRVADDLGLLTLQLGFGITRH